MPDDRLRFRCYRCNKLLGASSRRAGSVVACPRCKAELVVPKPEGPDGAGRDESHAAQAPSARPDDGGASEERPPGPDAPAPRSLMEEIAAAIPDELASLRPEDIRVEAEFADLVIDTRETTLSAPAPAPAAPAPEPPVTISAEALQAAAPVIAALDPQEAPPALEPGGILPEITLEPPSILPPGRELRPVREVVLQPATVLAWSLLVLLALPMAFVAGLLIGHFVWK